ncbi:MAG: histidine phosphatase family protein [Candidatus Omnitrophica bacterium]|nr:histidine phosphatase family protein [Candidatus Omnitrophota bacterium]
MITRIFLIRHGVTSWNRQRRYCGRIDVGLSREGKEQARKLRGQLEKIIFDRIYCSTKKRAQATCGIIFPGRKFTKVLALREINFGALEGLRHDEIMEKYGKVYENWLKDPYKYNIPGAEPISAFKKRINAAVKKIIGLNAGKTVAVVCHGGVIGIFVSSLLKSGDFWKYVPKATSVTVVEYKKNKLSLKKFNDVAHLEEK